jgi:hypothetical protein
MTARRIDGGLPFIGLCAGFFRLACTGRARKLG